MVAKIDGDSIVLIKQDKPDNDEFTSIGGRAKLEKAVAKAGGTLLSKLTKNVTHILMSDEFENAKVVSSPEEQLAALSPATPHTPNRRTPFAASPSNPHRREARTRASRATRSGSRRRPRTATTRWR